jgi:hypothetical protein
LLTLSSRHSDHLGVLRSHRSDVYKEQEPAHFHAEHQGQQGKFDFAGEMTVGNIGSGFPSFGDSSQAHDGDFQIHVTFNDSLQGSVDFQGWLQGPVFEPLQDPKLFSEVLRRRRHHFGVAASFVTWSAS